VGELGSISDRQRESLEAIVRSGRHLLRVISDILDLVKVESGKLEFHPEPVDLRAIVCEVVEILGPVAKKKEIALFVKFQQLDAGASKKYEGTGIGLVLTKRIVEAQGGFVGASSRAGKGSTFYAVLPCESAIASGEERQCKWQGS
jgi:signal transduction histidine kinase